MANFYQEVEWTEHDSRQIVHFVKRLAAATCSCCTYKHCAPSFVKITASVVARVAFLYENGDKIVMTDLF